MAVMWMLRVTGKPLFDEDGTFIVIAGQAQISLRSSETGNCLKKPIEVWRLSLLCQFYSTLPLAAITQTRRGFCEG